MEASHHAWNTYVQARRAGKTAKRPVADILIGGFAFNRDGLFVLEVNPRVSRTVPFLSKARRIPFARLAARIMAGRSIADLPELQTAATPDQVFVKASVFPFARLLGEDPVLGPEMKSTGEVMGRAPGFGQAFAKALSGAGLPLPTGGAVFLSVRDADKAGLVPIAKELAGMGFALVATSGTLRALESAGVSASLVHKAGEGSPDASSLLKAGTLRLVINTPMGRKSQKDETEIRCQATAIGVPCITTLEGARAAVEGIRALKSCRLTIRPIQEWMKG